MLLTPTTGRIDVQFHFIPDFWADLVAAVEPGLSFRGLWSVEKALQYMDRVQVSTGMLSVSAPSVNFLPVKESVSVARRLNEAAAEVARDNPGRFGNFATLPMLDVEATLLEIAYCLDTLHMDGVCVMSNCQGRYPGHETFTPIFAELHRRQAVVFLHPDNPSYTGTLAVTDVAEWPFDTARAAIDLMYSGTIRRFPGIRFILAHAGGALPAVIGRVEECAALFTRGGAKLTKAEIADEAKAFYYDLAISAGENVIGALRAVSDLNHVLFACDWPYAWDAAVETNVQNFEALHLTPDERRAIERGNAVQLFSPRSTPPS